MGKLLVKECVNIFLKILILKLALLVFIIVMVQMVRGLGEEKKAPAALARKFVEAKVKNSNEIEIWGNGEQVRSFMYVDDCLDGILKLIESNLEIQ